MSFRDDVLKIALTALHKHQKKIEDAVDEVEKKMRQLPEFKSFIDQIIHSYAREVVYDVRHTQVQKINRAAKVYGRPANVTIFQSGRMREIHKSLFDRHIAGKRFGDIRGAELSTIADQERALGVGHFENAALLTRLVKIVPADKRVEDSISLRKLTSIYQEVTKAA